MLREIKVKNTFKQIVEKPLVTGDNNAYEIVWEPGEKGIGATLQIIARRDDLKMICDTCTIGEEGIARYILKNNMYSIPGKLRLMLSVVSGDSILTEKILCFNVIPGSGITPPSAINKENPFVEAMENMNAHLTAQNPHNITREMLGVKELEDAFRYTSHKTIISKSTIMPDDYNRYLGFNLLGIQGNTVQEGEPTLDSPVEMVNVIDPKLTLSTTTIQLKGVFRGLSEVEEDYVRDRLYAKGGKVYYEKNVEVLNKPEDFNFEDAEQVTTWGEGIDNNFIVYKSRIPFSAYAGDIQYCNRMIYTHPCQYIDKTGFYCEDDYMYVILPAEEYPTAESFNNKIKEIFQSGEIFEVYYSRSVSEINEVENPQLLELYNFKKPFVTCARSNIPVYVEIDYNRNFEVLFTKIKESIEELGGHLNV